MMVDAATSTLQPYPSAEDTPQTHAYPAVEPTKRPLLAVFEVLKPAAKRRIEPGDDREETAAGVPFRLGSDRVLEFLQALRTGSASAAREPISQEVKARGPRVDHSRLGRVQRQAGLRRPLLNQFQG